MKKITGINIDMFLNRLLYSLYNLIYFFGLPIYAAVELLMLAFLEVWVCDACYSTPSSMRFALSKLDQRYAIISSGDIGCF